jgi:CDP-diacylglycerol--glycerol-3-phosphate 3-phosphatidyltransferase
VNPNLNLPNAITGSRLLLSALLALLLMFEQTMWLAFWAWVTFTIAAVSDFVDGYLARRWNSVTILGKLLDPLADKVLVTTALVMLIPLGKVPAWVALLMLCREILVTGLRGVASSVGVVIAASQLGKWKSIIQYIALGTLIFPEALSPIPNLHGIGTAILYAALLITIWSGWDYFFRLRHVFLDSPSPQ